MHRSVFSRVNGRWDEAILRCKRQITEVECPKEGKIWYDFLPRKRAREAAMAAAV